MPPLPLVPVGGPPLTVDDLGRVARDHAPVAVDAAVAERMRPCLDWLTSAAAAASGDASSLPIYGVNTGFGALAGREVFRRPEDAWELSRRLVLSNAAGTGRHLDEEVVR